MKRKGIPLIYHVTGDGDTLARGIRPALIRESHKGDYNGGLFAGGYSSVEGDFNGVVGAGGVSYIKGDHNGVVVSGGVSKVDGNYKGVMGAGGASYIEGNCNGVVVSGSASRVEGDLEGLCLSGGGNFFEGKLTGASVSSLYNSAKSNGKFAFMFGAFNNIEDYEDGVVIQLGLYNIADEQIHPLLNMRGVKEIVGKGVDKLKGMEFHPLEKISDFFDSVLDRYYSWKDKRSFGDFYIEDNQRPKQFNINLNNPRVDNSVE